MTDLNDFEIDVLRAMNGETVPGLIGGAGMWAAAGFLKGCGYADGNYIISEKGKAFLAERAQASSKDTGGQS